MSKSVQTNCRTNRKVLGRAATALAFYSLSILSTQASAQVMPLSKSIPLSGVQGRFDHLAIDVSGRRLFIAATGNHSVEVIDLKTDKVLQSISGLGKPHGLAWVAETGSLYMSDGALAELRVYKGTPFALAGTIKLSDDADDMVYDASNHLLFVGHGGSDAANPAKVAMVDTDRFALVGNLAVATHPEALDIDASDHRVFVNIADTNEVAVINTASKSIADHWKLSKAANNVPMAFDSEHRILYVACRTPGMLIALDTSTGKEVASQSAAGKADDLFYDPALRRIYVISGVGEIDTYQIDGTGSLKPLEILRTAPGAKTALFVPELGLLYVGVPGVDGHPAEVRAYTTGKAGERNP